jgi:AcrR family transcriptional regulator
MKVRTEVRRKAIIREATLLFGEQGFERASMSQLAKRLGGSKTTLYSYFPSKELLFTAVIESIGENLIDSALTALLSVDDRPLKQTLTEFGIEMTRLINQPEALAVYRMVLGEAGHSEVGHLFYKTGPQRVIDGVSKVIENAVEGGLLRQCEPSIAARHFLALIKSESEDHLYQRQPPILTNSEIKQSVDRAMQLFMAGYMAVN